jgi:putative flippase GtrA
MKFNMVGALGMGLQLSAFTLFNRWTAGHYLFASAASVELALLHNFVWHSTCTWRDRRDSLTPSQKLMRFHLSNGLVSIFGNLVLMRLLVHSIHLPLLVSNSLAILSCSFANFYLSHNWAFPVAPKTETPKTSTAPLPLYTCLLLLLLLLFLTPVTAAHAQSAPALPDSASPSQSSSTPLPSAPLPRPAYHPSPSDTYLLHVGAFCGAGASNSSAATKPTVGCGVGLTLLPLPIFFEVGVMGPQANRSYLSGYVSLDTSIPLARPTSTYLPMAIVGYSRLFETGHAPDYGLALALPRPGKQSDATKSLRLELRDYYTSANPTQHNMMFRIGWMGEEAD